MSSTPAGANPRHRDVSPGLSVAHAARKAVRLAGFSGHQASAGTVGAVTGAGCATVGPVRPAALRRAAAAVAARPSQATRAAGASGPYARSPAGTSATSAGKRAAIAAALRRWCRRWARPPSRALALDIRRRDPWCEARRSIKIKAGPGRRAERHQGGGAWIARHDSKGRADAALKIRATNRPIAAAGRATSTPGNTEPRQGDDTRRGGQWRNDEQQGPYHRGERRPVPRDGIADHVTTTRPDSSNKGVKVPGAC